MVQVDRICSLEYDPRMLIRKDGVRAKLCPSVPGLQMVGYSNLEAVTARSHLVLHRRTPCDVGKCVRFLSAYLKASRKAPPGVHTEAIKDYR